MATPATAQQLTVGPSDSIEKILAAHSGKVVTVRTGCDQELTGKVRSVSADVVHLAELTGKDFYDAVVATGSITAVIVRAR
ncbi:MAG TPA: hypothetical protein VEL28_15860 [Candidatus Binatia bacterium]|nr:hypothetical protein [Candidatus Binatia bacterium]